MYVWMDDDIGKGPYRPQMTVTLCTIPGQRATSDQTKRPYQAIQFVLVSFLPKLEPEILNCQILNPVLSRITNTLSTR